MEAIHSSHTANVYGTTWKEVAMSLNFLKAGTRIWTQGGEQRYGLRHLGNVPDEGRSVEGEWNGPCILST